MKSKSLRWIAYALTVLMLLQSCTIYRKMPVSIDEAVATNNSVKVYTTENEKYKFKRLVKEDDKIYGISHINGPNAKKFTNSIEEIYRSKSQVKILLPFDIKEVYIENKTLSTLVPIVLVVGILAIFVAESMSNCCGFQFGSDGG